MKYIYIYIERKKKKCTTENAVSSQNGLKWTRQEAFSGYHFFNANDNIQNVGERERGRYLLKLPWLLFQRFKSYGFSIGYRGKRDENVTSYFCLFNELARTVRLTFRSMVRPFDSTPSISLFVSGEVSKDIEIGGKDRGQRVIKRD